MGQAYTYRCGKCNYNVVSSGQLDWGFIAVVRPYICNDCKEVIDVLVGRMGQEIPYEMLNEKEKKEYYCCKRCNGRNLTVWNPKWRRCPKCSRRMRKKPGTIIDWD